MRDRLLREDEVLWTKFDLLLDTKIEERFWRDWWDKFAKMEREEFLREAGRLVGPDGHLAIARSLLKQ